MPVIFSLKMRRSLIHATVEREFGVLLLPIMWSEKQSVFINLMNEYS